MAPPLTSLFVACFVWSASLSLAEVIDCNSSKCKCKEPGHCEIFCDSAAEQCRGSKLRCLPGFPCTIHCLGDGACLESKISGNDATHVDLVCDGSAACHSGKFYCGTGDCTLQCVNGDDCTGIRVKTATKAHSFLCDGHCPQHIPPPFAAQSPAPSTLLGGNLGRPTKIPTARPTPKPSPAPTAKPVAPQLVQCKGSSKKCQCDGTKPCHIKCGSNQCTENTLICPRHFDCTVSCGKSACTKAVVEGPRGSDFELRCSGTASCGDALIGSGRARDVRIECSGKDSCKGAGSAVHCGAGLCALEFSGEAAGTDAAIHSNGALGFHCSGRYAQCPRNYEAPCSGIAEGDCSSAQFLNLATCRCECPYSPQGEQCPNALQRFNPLSCRCELECPPGTPTESECAAQGLEWRDCGCFGSNYCCRSGSAAMDYRIWAGICWGETTEDGCGAVPNGRCEWRTADCLPNPPTNSLDRASGCKFALQRCSKDKECCSEFCRVDGSCR